MTFIVEIEPSDSARSLLVGHGHLPDCNDAEVVGIWWSGFLNSRPCVIMKSDKGPVVRFPDELVFCGEDLILVQKVIEKYFGGQ